MTRNSSTLAVAVVVGLLVGLAAVGGVGYAQSDEEPDAQETSYLRVIHASPDAPPVDVMVDDETVLTDVPFGAVSDYLSLPAGSHNITITAANESDTVVFDGQVTVEPRTVTTLVAAGEVGENATTPFDPILFADDAVTPADDQAAISVVHLSPDAPAVDVTARNGSVVLANNVSYANASDYVTVPAGDYTVEIRQATADDDGPVVATTDVSLSGGTAYSALAVGYLESDNASAEAPFQVVLTEDATKTIELPAEATEVDVPGTPEAGDRNETMTETPAVDDGESTETPTMGDSGTETEDG